MFDIDSEIKECEKPVELKGLSNNIEFKKFGYSLKADPNEIKPMDIKKLIDKFIIERIIILDDNLNTKLCDFGWAV